MKDMVLFPEDIERLNAVLSQLVFKANLLLGVLVNKDGRLLTCQGSLGDIDTVSMAALVAGNSASTLAIANLMGEKEFSTMYHQGKDKHIYIAAVDENTFLVLVFDDRTNIDRVKVFARQFDRQVKHSLLQVYNKTEDMIDLDLDMNYDQYNDAMQQNQEQNSQQDYYPPPPQQQQESGSFSLPLSTGFNDSTNPMGSHQHPHQQSNSNGAPNDSEDDVYYIEPQNTPVNSSKPHDTNYLYLQNKIRESVKRKSDES